MEPQTAHVSNQTLRTPRAAAVAGIVFSVLIIISFINLQISIPPESDFSPEWLEQSAGNVIFALSLLPFAGIAFLWFMGVVRDRIGLMEDQFFSTLFFGSGLLYLAMTFATAALAGGIIGVFRIAPQMLFNNGLYIFARASIHEFNNIFAIRMAGMHMFVLGTIWWRTAVMPRWVALITFPVALLQVVGIQFFPWATLIFPAWVFLISTYILVLNYRYQKHDCGSISTRNAKIP